MNAHQALSRTIRVTLLACGLLLALSSCGGAAPQAPQQSAPPPLVPTAPSSGLANPTGQPAPTAGAPAGSDFSGILVDASGPARPFDRRLLGTNVPAWLRPEGLRDPAMQQRVAALGETLIRLPGGSWSNAYDWLACENGSEDGCYWTWAARPSDFIDFLQATGQEAIWTVSINGTAKEAAALVAFFNGAVDDETPIGLDVRGRDWLTVGHWARLRAEHGNPEPQKIRLWEVGNEVYGAKPNAGPRCAPWGWEDVWTCDGVEYVTGKGGGTERREGYLDFRAAMRAVDPDILVGAVGVANPNDWSGWGNDVIARAGADLDFYVVHQYGFEGEPSTPQEALELPQRIWGRVTRGLQEAFARYGDGRTIPIAVTEYNLVAFQDNDRGQLMRRAVNALYIADTIGQMAENGVVMANQYNLANGVAENGTDYGMVDAKSLAPNPQYYALLLWQQFGSELLPVSSGFRADRELSVYAGRGEGGTITLLAINKTNRAIETSVRVAPAAGALQGTADLLQAKSLEAPTVSLNERVSPAGLDEAPGQVIERFEGDLPFSFAPYSVTLLRLKPAP